MAISRVAYNACLVELHKAEKRLKRDREIIKIVRGVIRTKNLSLNKEKRLNMLLVIPGGY